MNVPYEGQINRATDGCMCVRFVGLARVRCGARDSERAMDGQQQSAWSQASMCFESAS